MTPGPFILPVRCAHNRSGGFVQYVPEKLFLHEGEKCQGMGGFFAVRGGVGVGICGLTSWRCWFGLLVSALASA
ncbi:hypothetical protein, partial [Paraburkholderia caribensis]|uniref:hypothetical protein n=1 Tax=Paraburkholderia caribensis TaxID=75105 RepID=UPI003F578E98